MNLYDLQKICILENLEITLHAAKRLEQRGIVTDDILSCIHTGEIIEQYPDDYPLPSCLIFGKSVSGKPLHVVVGSDLDTLWIITAYYPNPDKWEDDMKTRKEILQELFYV